VALRTTARRRSQCRLSRIDRLSELIAVRALCSGGQAYAEDARSDRRLDFGDLPQAVTQWGGLLDDLGVAVGASVAVAIKDPLDFAAAFIGVMGAGRFLAPIDPSAPDAALAASCEQIAPTLICATRPPPLGLELDWVQMAEGGVGSAEAVVSEKRRPHRPSRLTEAGSGGVVLCSSGTTGKPKLIALDEALLLGRARAIASHHELTASDRGFNPLPLFHINAEVVGLLASLVAGASIVLDDRFHRSGFWDLMTRREITWINAVPAIVDHLSQPSPDERLPTRVRFVRSASAPLALGTHDRFATNVGIPILETYGMTEAASQITANPMHGVRKRGSVGLPVATELRIAPMQPPQAGSQGSAWSRPIGHVEIFGAGVIRRYAAPGYEDRFARDGWLRTGDLGYIDDDGYVFLVGREDDVINRGGFKVMPRDIEEVILVEPAVKEAVVVGRYDQALGEVPVAFIVLRAEDPGPDDVAAAMAAIGRRCADALAGPSRPAALHLVEAIPRGPTGKLRPKALRHDEVVPLASVTLP
jgi:oxalate---CoA ligase